MGAATSAATKHSPFQLLYGFNPRHALDLLTDKPSVADDWTERRENMRKDAADAIVMTQQNMIKYGDVKRKPVGFAVGDKVYLRLNNGKGSMPGYTLSGTIKPKLSQQRAGPFEVTRIVGKNAYRLKLPITWKIWPVISVIYLEPAKTPDPFGREVPQPPPVVRNADDPDAEWEVEAIVKKRTTRETRRRRDENEYLLRWKGFGSEFDEWKNEEELEECKKLIKEYEMSVGNYGWSSPTSWNNDSNPTDNAATTNSDFTSTETSNAAEINFSNAADAADVDFSTNNAATTNSDSISTETFNFSNISSITDFDPGQDLLM
jgi:Chromo (CHRromatin Organisation MOdifier) domain